MNFSRWRRLGCLFVTGCAVSGCDQYSKSQAVDALSSASRQTVTVLDPWVDLTLAFNRGTAFSVVRDAGHASWLLAGFALVVVALMGWWLWREGGWLRCLGAGLIAGGAVGNAFDRLFREGVVDFIAVTLPGGYRWPTFNVADAALMAGAVALLLLGLRAKPKPDPETSRNPA